ncbi:uncharacterized protein LOC112560826 isoform X2 [Pomacea canaliculata]|uniref:uncharacterized protein LOC112560826 isoform X2 n=1 Tax=Pomacea canaliculata TaxID=400727 RepID=UPI000D7276C1|nr:uncharacterized protein LOC112560826 isoform X2 [Pomacea canaliculata]
MAALPFLLVVLVTSCVADNNCLPYDPEPSFHENQCYVHHSFRELDGLLTGASTSSHQTVYMSVIVMHRYIHKCDSFEMAVGRLFHIGPADVGRRQSTSQEYLYYERMLHPKLETIREESDIACVQALINKYHDAAARFWASRNGIEYTTVEVTTHSTTTHAPVPTTTTAAVTYPPVRCWICSGLDCLLHPASHTGQLCPADQTFCKVTVTDLPNDRIIIRSCASASVCDFLYLSQTRNNPECMDVERRIMANNTQCDFCCTGDNCNKAPSLIPEVTSLYS